MTGTYSKDEALELAFVVTPDHVRDFATLITKNIESETPPTDPPISYRVKFPAGGSFQTTSLDEILSLSNSGNKRILGLDMHTHYSVTPRIDVSLSASSETRNVSYHVVGTDQQAFYIADQILEALQRTRQWYTRIAHADLISIGMTIILSLTVLVALGILIKIATKDLPEPIFTIPGYLGGTILGYAGGFLIATFVGAATRMRDHLFPAGIFTIGDGKERYERIVFWRRTFWEWEFSFLSDSN